MRAIGDSIILKRIRMEKKTESGIEIVQENKRHDAQLSVGQIVAMGPLALEKEMAMEREFGMSCAKPREGDFVLTARYAGSEVTVDGDEYKLCLPGDLLAIITEDQVKEMTTWKP